MAKPSARTAGGARTLPGRYYTSSAIFARELEELFARRWLLAGRASELPEPGSTMLFELAPEQRGHERVPHESVVIVRGADTQIRAFHNVCRHRGARLCPQAESTPVSAIRCPYHAWTYSLDGRLLGAPNMATVADFDRADYPLIPVAVVEWEGFVLINLDPEPTPFAEAYAPISTKFEPWQLSRLQVGHRVDYEVNANWKLLFENYVECNHCPVIHPALNRVTPYQDAQNDLDSGEILGGPMRIADDDQSMTKTGKLCAPALVDGPLLRQIYYYTVMPNFWLSLHPDYVLTHRLEPVATDQTRVVCEWLFDPTLAQTPGSNPLEAVEFWDQVNRQDWAVCELSQHGVTSRGYQPGPYSEYESLSAAFDRAYLAALAASGAGLDSVD